MRSHGRIKVINWFAILCFLFVTFAPSISQALAKNESNTNTLVFEVCSHSGLKMIHSPMQEDGHPFKRAQDHCPYCMSPLTDSIPMNRSLNFIQAETLSLFPQLFYQSPQPLYTWRLLPSRAPPSVI